MTHAQQPHRTLPPELAFFAAANTADGFVNRFPALFGTGSGIERLYVIKGGPGTGKSRFLRTVADYAAARGERIITFYCSSDPHSLDGLIVSSPAGAVGFIDGTPPHGWELSRPGVREELIDLGAFWQVDSLTAHGDEIERLCADKSAAYTQAYRWLRACGEVDRAVDHLVLPLCDEDALSRRAERLLRSAMRRHRADATAADADEGHDLLLRLSPCGRILPPLFRRGYAMTGTAGLGTLEACAEHVICLTDKTGVGAVFMSCLATASEKAGLPALVTNAPLRPDRIDGLLWPTLRLCVVCGESGTEQVSAAEPLTLHRYVDSDRLRRVRAEIRTATALRDGLAEAALGSLTRARDAHFALEALYTAAMDFAAKEAFTQEFCHRVFGT